MDPRPVQLTLAQDWHVITEDDISGFTHGASYNVYGMIIDAAPTPPAPYLILTDDSGHFRLVDISKVRRGP